MLVYRIEHPEDRRGPYTSNHFDKEWRALLCKEHRDARETHPTPEDDHNLGSVYSFSQVFGFTDVRSLETWFDGWLGYLQECGFVLSMYEADSSCRVGMYGQVIFDCTAKRVHSTTDLT